MPLASLYMLALTIASIAPDPVSTTKLGDDVVPSTTYNAPNQLVRVDDGRRLNMLCMGVGSPTVVLESGLGIGLVVWQKTQARISKFTRVCSYDRAGYGFSDPSTRPSDAKNAAADLDQLIIKGPLNTPIVLVGHSVGGLYAELYAAKHRSRVAGVVLVDPTGLDDFRLVKTMISPEEATQQRSSFEKRMSQAARCLALARKGAPSGPAGDECAADLSGDETIDRTLRLQDQRVNYRSALLSEYQSFYPEEHPLGVESRTTAQVRAHAMRLGNRPLIILRTPGRVPPGLRGEQLREASDGVAERLSKSSKRGRLVYVTSGHDVQNEHPDIVASAVRDVVFTIRGDRDRGH